MAGDKGKRLDPVARGRAARKTVPRSHLGDWDPSRRGHDALATILAQNTMRDQRLIAIRHGRMSASPWTYYRGAAAVMAADLASRPNTGITVQMCGDAHVLNFGLWNTPERSLAFDLRDFDETLPGPFEWDLLRFLTSLVVLARENGVPAEVADASVRAGLHGYRTWMKTYSGGLSSMSGPRSSTWRTSSPTSPPRTPSTSSTRSWRNRPANVAAAAPPRS